MLRGQTPSAVPAKGFAGSSKHKLIQREELSKDTQGRNTA